MTPTTIAIFGCLVWMPLAVWIISLLHWAIQGDLDPVTAFFGIGLAFGLGYTAAQPPIPILSPISCGTVLLAVIFFPAVQSSLQKRQHRSIDIDNIDRAYRSLGQRPDNPLAKFKLAEAVYRVGLIGHAVALGDEAMANVSERVATEEYRVLKRWKAIGVPPDTMRPISCVECHGPCQPGWTHCRSCGAQFLADRARGRILPSGMPRRLISVWVAVVVLLVGIPSSTVLPSFAAGIAILGLVIAAGGVVYMAFRAPAQATQ